MLIIVTTVLVLGAGWLFFESVRPSACQCGRGKSAFDVMCEMCTIEGR